MGKVRRDFDPEILQWDVFLFHPWDAVGEVLGWEEHTLVVEPVMAHSWIEYGALGIFFDRANAEAAALRYDRWRGRLLSRCSGCRPGWRRYCPM
jgi:hypothetical protein